VDKVFCKDCGYYRYRTDSYIYSRDRCEHFDTMQPTDYYGDNVPKPARPCYKNKNNDCTHFKQVGFFRGLRRFFVK